VLPAGVWRRCDADGFARRSVPLKRGEGPADVGRFDNPITPDPDGCTRPGDQGQPCWLSARPDVMFR
jgi:hypothetical protein